MGWIRCDGRSLLVKDYPQLFSVIGYNFGGSGDTFQLPYPDGRVMAFVGQADTVPATDWVMGDLSGEEMHTLTIAELPAHNHDICGGSLDVSNGIVPTNSGKTSREATDIGIDTSGGYYGLIFSSRGGAVDTTRGGPDFLDVTTGEPSLTTHVKPLVITDPKHRHSIASNGTNSPHNNIQPTIWLGYLFVYGGKLFKGTDNLSAPYSQNLFPYPPNGRRIY